jgi:hypothetical protein
VGNDLVSGAITYDAVILNPFDDIEWHAVPNVPAVLPAAK